MAKRVILGGLVGGVVYFIWGAVAHMMTPLGHTGLSILPADKEDALLAAMRAAAPKDGLYFFPGCEGMYHPVSESQQQAWMEKMKAGPRGLLLVHGGSDEVMSPGQLGTELATDVLAALMAGLLLSATRLGYAGRVGFVTLLGLFGWVTISLPYWNWYDFPLDFTLAAALEEGFGWLLAGTALAAVVRPTSASKPGQVCVWWRMSDGECLMSNERWRMNGVG
jgi:hypothetical protein